MLSIWLLVFLKVHVYWSVRIKDLDENIEVAIEIKTIFQIYKALITSLLNNSDALQRTGGKNPLNMLTI